VEKREKERDIMSDDDEVTTNNMREMSKKNKTQL
jgi:hypothetical protein